MRTEYLRPDYKLIFVSDTMSPYEVVLPKRQRPGTTTPSRGGLYSAAGSYPNAILAEPGHAEGYWDYTESHNLIR